MERWEKVHKSNEKQVKHKTKKISEGIRNTHSITLFAIICGQYFKLQNIIKHGEIVKCPISYEMVESHSLLFSDDVSIS